MITAMFAVNALLTAAATLVLFALTGESHRREDEYGKRFFGVATVAVGAACVCNIIIATFINRGGTP